MRSKNVFWIFASTILFTIAQAAPVVAAQRPRVAGRLGSVPLFARINKDHDLRAYTVPLTVNVSVHKIIFTFHRALNGNVKYSAPSKLVFDGNGVPPQFKSLFGDLGSPLTWEKRYALRVTGRARRNGVPCHTLEGVPRKQSQVQSLAIETTSASAPIQANWTLQGGWTVAATLYEQNDHKYLLPKQAQLDIVGHGYNIHAAMLYGVFALQSSAPRIAHVREQKKVTNINEARKRASSFL